MHTIRNLVKDIGIDETFIKRMPVKRNEKFNKVKDLLHNIRDEKMKGKKFKIEVARKVVKKVEE